MTKVVVDTNVIVSAILTPNGNAAQIMTLISFGDLQLYYCDEIIEEYKRVLSYSKLKLPTQLQRSTIGSIKMLGTPIHLVVSTFPMADGTDRAFYDTAKTAGAILITGNIRHYPNEVFIVTPAEFLRLFTSGSL